MGIESYSILVISKNVQVIKKQGCWKLEGKSHCCMKDLDKILGDMGMENSYNNRRWVFDNYLEIHTFSENAYAQAIEIKGCLSWLKEGIPKCYEIIKNIDAEIMPVDIYILDEHISILNAIELYEAIDTIYKDKITIFKKQYGEISLKTNCEEFYGKMKKISKWYYKLYRRIVK